MAAQLVHVWVVLGQDGDSVALLPDDEPGLLLRGTPQVYAIELGRHPQRAGDRMWGAGWATGTWGVGWGMGTWMWGESWGTGTWGAGWGMGMGTWMWGAGWRMGMGMWGVGWQMGRRGGRGGEEGEEENAAMNMLRRAALSHLK